MQKTIQLPNNWSPRDYQKKLWNYLEGGGTRAVEAAHRRWGKDDVALHFTATAAHQKIGNYWHMLPMYGQARKVVWTAINPKTGKRRIDEAFPKEIRRKTKEQEMLIEFRNGSMWQLVGSDNYDAIVGSPPIGIVFSEWALANPMAWAYLSPILEENGGWALFIYTSRGNNHGRTIYEHAISKDAWFGEKLTVLDTPVFSAEQVKGIREEYINIFGPELGEALFDQEYMCSWEGAVFGAYFTKQIRDARAEKRITKVPHMPGVEVDTFWDLGVDDSTTIWFMQPLGKSFNFIDYYEATGYGLEHYAKVLKEKNYVYGNHWMPHDAAQREMSSGEIAKSKKEVAEDLGIRPVEIVRRARNMDIILMVHIPAVRNVMAQCWFDEEKCSRGLMALENYRSEYNEEKKVLSNRPTHDWSSHGSDAFRTFAVGYSPRVQVHQPQRLNLGQIYTNQGQGWMAG
uniref:Putative terminase n=1 Tax=viral metagenome TaxID=1070528 RepID=A0A6M3K7S1_9ZZZZ